MKTNSVIDGSFRLFLSLMNFYPQEYRKDYSTAMQQVFTQQCRDAYKEKGFWGVVILWLRILPDLGYTAIVEHLTSPRASWGLLEPVRGAPLPWKGVFLVLLPGLVYLIGQIAQITGKPWYPILYYRAAFVLILPVLAVWGVTRRFPIWGLIPLGLLYRVVKEIGYQLITLNPGAFSHHPFLKSILMITRTIESNLWILAIVFIVLSVSIAVWYGRNFSLNKRFWMIFLGLIFVFLIKIGFDLNAVLAAFDQIPLTERGPILKEVFISSISYQLYDMTALLLLVFLGTLFTRRHGFFAIFILVGYILPVIVIGFPWFQDINEQQIMVLSAGVLAYRSLLTLVGPIWMSRTPDLRAKRRAIIISISLALGIHAVMQFYPVFLGIADRIAIGTWISYVAFEELLLIFTFLMALALYRDIQPENNNPVDGGRLPEMIATNKV